jgi:hypothetical protein
MFSLVIAAPNPRMGEEINNPELVVKLATCYEQKMDDSIGLSFEEYVALDIISEECESLLATMKTIYEEQLEFEPGVLIDENVIDSDGDLFSDKEEITHGTDTNNPEDFPWWTDVDGDGFSNEEELFENVNPLDKENVPTIKIVKDDTVKKAFPWQIYLAIALGLILIVVIVIYFAYYDLKD